MQGLGHRRRRTAAYGWTRRARIMVYRGAGPSPRRTRAAVTARQTRSPFIRAQKGFASINWGCRLFDKFSRDRLWLRQNCLLILLPLQHRKALLKRFRSVL